MRIHEPRTILFSGHTSTVTCAIKCYSGIIFCNLVSAMPEVTKRQPTGMAEPISSSYCLRPPNAILSLTSLRSDWQ